MSRGSWRFLVLLVLYAPLARVTDKVTAYDIPLRLNHRNINYDVESTI